MTKSFGINGCSACGAPPKIVKSIRKLRSEHARVTTANKDLRKGATETRRTLKKALATEGRLRQKIEGLTADRQEARTVIEKQRKKILVLEQEVARGDRRAQNLRDTKGSAELHLIEIRRAMKRLL